MPMPEQTRPDAIRFDRAAVGSSAWCVDRECAVGTPTRLWRRSRLSTECPRNARSYVRPARQPGHSCARRSLRWDDSAALLCCVCEHKLLCFCWLFRMLFFLEGTGILMIDSSKLFRRSQIHTRAGMAILDDGERLALPTRGIVLGDECLLVACSVRRPLGLNNQY